MPPCSQAESRFAGKTGIAGEVACKVLERRQEHHSVFRADGTARFEEEIAALESQIAEADAEKATFEQLLEFSKSLLVDISTAWQKADVSQKQRVKMCSFQTA